MSRVLLHHLGFAGFATTSLALPVGATLVVFTIVNALWLSPVPFPDPDRLVMVVGEDLVGSVDGALFTRLQVYSPAWNTVESFAGQVATSGQLASLRPHIALENVGRDLEILAVTSEYFRVLGVTVRGRDFTREDDRSGAVPVAIMSGRMWSREFGRRLDVSRVTHCDQCDTELVVQDDIGRRRSVVRHKRRRCA